MKMLALLPRYFLLALLLAAGSMQPAMGASISCSSSTTNMAFGTVSLLAGGITDSSTTITTTCSAKPGNNLLICLNIGADPNTGLYDPRNLGSGSNRMAFNLYTDAARTTVWGDKLSTSYPPVSLTLTFGPGESSKSITTNLYGRINASGQKGLPAGTYDTTYTGGWSLTTNATTYNKSPPTCTTGGMSTDTATLNISAVVNSECLLNSSTDIDFGTVFQTLSQNVDSTATITVTCNGGSGSGYYILLSNGLSPSGLQRRMQGPGGSFINYGLYQDATRSVAWGNTNATGVQGTGTGQPQSLTVYGRVPPQPVPGAGTYSDTIVITLSY